MAKNDHDLLIEINQRLIIVEKLVFGLVGLFTSEIVGFAAWAVWQLAKSVQH